MRTHLTIFTCLFLSSLGIGTTATAAAPVPINAELIPIGELVVEVDSRVKELEGFLATADVYEENREEAVRQAFGVLACVAQAIAEHADAATVKIQGPALRDAALQFKKTSTLDEAKAALAAIQAAHVGTSTVEAAAEHPWNKLINMHPMMEEINARNAKLLRVFRRIRGNDDEVAHASTLVVLALAMQADTHEVKKEADLPKWEQWSVEYRTQMLEVAKAIRAKDAKSAREWFDKANATCDACHEVFQE
ncbi:MAG: hypothetical protein KDA58_06840 [Planctomycetaceae bacterium]|nr:hypothetical protein [Planctomycetaceae bacterium]